MPNLSRYQIPAPAHWEDFEDLGLDLWKLIWKDPNAQKHGRKGQSQQGVDIWGTPQGTTDTEGVQCKGKDGSLDSQLTTTEIDQEVEKAMSFEPKLSVFTIATTAPTDAKLQKHARLITQKHVKDGLFKVYVKSWPEIMADLGSYPELINKHFGELTPPHTETSPSSADDLSNLENEKLDPPPSKLPEEAKGVTIYGAATINQYSDDITSEHQAELDHSRELLKSQKSVEALHYLEELKNRIWSNAKPIIKFRILTNIASARLALNEENEAAKLFMEARQYNPDEEKAVTNFALGHLLLSQNDEAVRVCDEAIAINPANTRAYAIKVQALANTIDFDQLVELVPEAYRDSSEVANAFAFIAKNKEDLPTSRKWLEKAVADDNDETPELKGAMASLIMEMLLRDQTEILLGQSNKEQVAEIKHAIELWDQAWAKIGTSETRKHKTEWLYNRSLAKKLLDDTQGAISDISLAVELKPESSLYKKHLAALLHESGDIKKAIELMRGIVGSDETPEAVPMLADLLSESGNYKESAELLEGFLNEHPDEDMRKEAQILLIQIHLRAGEAEAAKLVADQMRAEEPTSIWVLASTARVASMQGDSDQAKSLLREAVGYVTESTPTKELVVLADTLYANELFTESADIYQTFVNSKLDSDLSRRLLNSYYRSGRHKEALELSKALLEQYGPLPYISEIESVIYEDIGDLASAEAVCSQYLEKFPEDIEMALRFAVIHYRKGNFEELDRYLESQIDTSKLSLQSFLQLATLFSERGKHLESMDALYEARRKYFDDPDAHLKYVGLFLSKEKYNEKWFRPKEAQAGVVVYLKDQHEQTEEYLIEDRADVDVKQKEIGTAHPIALKLIGKKVGDKIILKDSMTVEEGTITELKSKYVYAFQESLTRFERIFPTVPGLIGVKVNMEKTDDTGMPQDLRLMLDQVSKRADYGQQVEKLYKEGKLTVGAFAKLIGSNFIDTFYGMMGKPDLGVKVALGNNEELDSAVKVVASNVLVPDLTALLTLHGLKLGDTLVKKFGRLAVAQSTIDELRQVIAERDSAATRGYMSIAKEGDKFTRQQITKKDLKKNLKQLRSLLDWITKNCDVMPVTAALEIDKGQRDRLEEVLGQSSMDTILLAKEQGRTLYSDDERLRNLAHVEYGVAGTWSQAVLTALLVNQDVNHQQYQEATIKLVSSHYRHTFINADTLILAAEQADWSPKSPFTTVMQAIGSNEVRGDSIAVVITDFLYDLWKKPILIEQRMFLVQSALQVVSNRKDRDEIFDKLALRVKRRFTLIPLAAKEVIDFIDSWRQARHL